MICCHFEPIIDRGRGSRRGSQGTCKPRCRRPRPGVCVCVCCGSPSCGHCSFHGAGNVERGRSQSTCAALLVASSRVRRACLWSTCGCSTSTSTARSTSAGRITMPCPTCSRASTRPSPGRLCKGSATAAPSLAALVAHAQERESRSRRRPGQAVCPLGQRALDATAHQPRSPSLAPLAAGPDSSPPAPARLFMKLCLMLTEPWHTPPAIILAWAAVDADILLSSCWPLLLVL
jgi:hypothetical protein